MSQKEREDLFPASDVVGGVLVGGQSSRMGTNKALLQLEKTSFVERVWKTLAPFVVQRFLVTRHTFYLPSYPCLFDACERLGPIGAGWTLLRYARFVQSSFVLVLACDIPFISAPFLERLLLIRRNNDCLAWIPCEQKSGIEQNLCAIYSTKALPYFEKAIHEGVFALHRVIPREKKTFLFYDTQESALFFNLNTPQDLEQAKGIYSLCKEKKRGFPTPLF